MRNSPLAVVLTGLLAQSSISSPVLRKTVISGRVEKTETFARKLPNGLWFCLHPDPDGERSSRGWRMQIGSICDPSAENFTIVTPPLHGPNPTMIDAWHFDPQANAPRRVREFTFVVRKEAYDAILASLNSGADAGTVLSEFDRLGRGHGVLTVRRFARHKNARGESVFDWLEFRAELSER